MKEIILDCSAISDKASLHAALKESLAFPQWYGGNLDALHDCLTTIATPTKLTLLHWQELDDRLGTYAARAVYVLHDACEENPNLTVSLEA